MYQSTLILTSNRFWHSTSPFARAFFQSQFDYLFGNEYLSMSGVSRTSDRTPGTTSGGLLVTKVVRLTSTSFMIACERGMVIQYPCRTQNSHRPSSLSMEIDCLSCQATWNKAITRGRWLWIIHLTGWRLVALLAASFLDLETVLKRLSPCITRLPITHLSSCKQTWSETSHRPTAHNSRGLQCTGGVLCFIHHHASLFVCF